MNSFKIWGRLASAFLLTAALSGTAGATVITFTEIGDAGQSIGGAQDVNSMPGGTQLDAIDGTLEAGGADIFHIYLTGGQTFSASTIDTSVKNFFDMQLFLFDSAGFGVYANDDDPSSPPQSTLPAGITFTPVTAGDYYLAIAGTGFMPTSAGGSIFPVSLGFLDQSGGIQGAVGPTGPGGGSALTGWSSVSSESGDYEIALTGAQFLPSAAVPEPATAWLLGGGLVLAGTLRRYARQRK